MDDPQGLLIHHLLAGLGYQLVYPLQATLQLGHWILLNLTALAKCAVTQTKQHPEISYENTANVLFRYKTFLNLKK